MAQPTRTRKLATLTLAALLTLPTSAAIAKPTKPKPADQTKPPTGVTRIQGNNRVLTAIAVSNDMYPPASKKNTAPKQRLDRVIMVSAESWADAAIATPLAAKGSPILVQFNHEKGLDRKNLEEMQRVLKKNGTVTIIGNTTTLNKKIEQDIAKAGYLVERIGGNTDAQTSSKVAGKVVEENKPTGFLGALNDLTGGWFEAAQTIYAVPDATNDWETLIVAGNIAARNNGMVVIGATETQHVAKQYSKPVVKLGNWTDWPTDITPARTFDGPAATLALTADPNMQAVAFARAQDGVGAPYFADALTGGLHAARQGKGLILTTPTRITNNLDKAVSKYTAGTKTDVFYGGPEAISDAVAKALANPTP